MFNPMKIGCPKCNPKGHKSEDKIQMNVYDMQTRQWISQRCRFCFGTHFVDWIELVTGGKRISFSGSISSSSRSSSSGPGHIKPIRRKDDYVRKLPSMQQKMSINFNSSF